MSFRWGSIFLFCMVSAFSSQHLCPVYLVVAAQQPPSADFAHSYTGAANVFYETGYELSPFGFQDFRGFQVNANFVEGGEGAQGVRHFYSHEWLRILEPGDYVRIFNPTSQLLVLEGEISKGSVPGLFIGGKPLADYFDFFLDDFPMVLFTRQSVLPRVFSLPEKPTDNPTPAPPDGAEKT